MSQIILEREHKDCPFRIYSCTASGWCGIVFNRNLCEVSEGEYPEWCPILNHDVVVRAIIKEDSK